MDAESQNLEPSNDHDNDLSGMLALLGLDQYTPILRENGFDELETLAYITESDMSELGFKLGDRRKLQRAICESAVFKTSTTEGQMSTEPNSTERSSSSSGATPNEKLQSSPSDAHPRRAWRRRPQPDHNAPPKPKSAYVLFGEHVRKDPAVRNMRFADVSRHIGKLWAQFPAQKRKEEWETPAADKLQQYKVDMEQYKQTSSYRTYVEYLENFGEKHSKPGSSVSTTENPFPTAATVESGSLQPKLKQEDVDMAGQSCDDIDFTSTISPTPDHLENMSSPTISGMVEVGQILQSFGVASQVASIATLPPERDANLAVQAFLNGTGALLYLWDYDEALGLVQSVYHSQQDPASFESVEVFAMSAVGSCCDGDSYLAPMQKEFLHLFLNILSSSPAICDLRYARLFTCLALCRFTESIGSARRLIWSALEIARETFASVTFEAELPPEGPRYWRRIFRSVGFLERLLMAIWFAYNTGQESRITEEDLVLFHDAGTQSPERSDSVQHRVIELGKVAARIALDMKDPSRPIFSHAQLRFAQLDDWHRTLPASLQLSHLNSIEAGNLTGYKRRTLLQLHILFLGLFTEPYRPCLVELGNVRLKDVSRHTTELSTLIEIEDHCVLAARQSARVTALLQQDCLIRSHCWVLVYVKYVIDEVARNLTWRFDSRYTCSTACLILLFSASQKLLMLGGEEIGHDLGYASAHLNALSWCSRDNVIAGKLFSILQIMFSNVVEIMVSPIYRDMRTSRSLLDEDVSVFSILSTNPVRDSGELGEDIARLARRVLDALHKNQTEKQET